MAFALLGLNGGAVHAVCAGWIAACCCAWALLQVPMPLLLAALLLGASTLPGHACLRSALNRWFIMLRVTLYAALRMHCRALPYTGEW